MTHDIRSRAGFPFLQWGPRASYLGLVKGRPFKAQFETTQMPMDAGKQAIEQKASGTVRRDSSGRVRLEIREEGTEQQALELVIITDFGARTAVVLDAGSRAAMRFVDMGSPSGFEVPAAAWAYSGPWSLGGSPEERIIEGLVCKKAQPVARSPISAGETKTVGEIWVSEEIKYSVREHITEGELEHMWRLFDIRRVPSAESLFVVPEGYTEVTRSKFDTPP